MKTGSAHSEPTERDREILYSLRKRDPRSVEISLTTIEHVLDRLDEAELDERLCSGLDMYYKATTRRLLSQPEEDDELKAFERHMAKQLSYRFHLQESPRKRIFHNRWDLLKEMVADQRKVFKDASHRLTDAALLRRQHVGKVLLLIASHGSRGMYQKDLVRDMKVAKSTISTISTNLQEARLVKKSGKGKENLLTITYEGLVAARKLKQRELASKRPPMNVPLINDLVPATAAALLHASD